MDKKKYFMECVSQLGLSRIQVDNIGRLINSCFEGITDEADNIDVDGKNNDELSNFADAVHYIIKSKDFFREMEARAHRLYEIADYISKNEYTMSKKLGISGDEPDDDYMLMG